MLNFLDPRFLLAALIGSAVLFAAGDYSGAHRERKKIELRDAKAEAAALNQVRDASRRNVIAIDNIAAANQKEKDDAKAKIDKLRADVRSGAVRLSVATRACHPSGDTGAPNSEARGELLPQLAESILAIGAEADNVVRDLNACIDAYSAIREGQTTKQ